MPTEPEPEFWERPIAEVFPAQPPLQDIDYMCEQADLLLPPDRAAWMKRQYRTGWETLCDAPHHRRINRKVVATPGSSAGQAIARMIKWTDDRGLLYSADLPVIAGTQTYVPNAAVKFGYDLADLSDPQSKSWKARPVFNGGTTAYTDGTSRAHWTSNENIAFSQQPLIDMMAIIVQHNIKAVVVTDYTKFFLQLRRNNAEIASNSIYFDGKFHWWACQLFGEKSTPYMAHLHGDLLQRIIERELNAKCKGRVWIVRRTDDQAVLLDNPTDATLAHDTITKICDKAGAWLQRDKELVGVSAFKFDGYQWDLQRGANGAVSIPQDKEAHLRRELQELRTTQCTRQRFEKAQGLLVWVVVIYPTLKPYLPAVRRCWQAASHDHDRVRLSTEAKYNLRRLEQFFETDTKWTPLGTQFEGVADVTLWTDGSGHGGVGGFTLAEHFSWKMPDRFQQHHDDLDRADKELSSTWVELAALLIALLTLPTVQNSRVMWWTDSQAAVAVWQRHSSATASINRLLTSIDFACARRGICVYPRWHERESTKAQLADQLSKFDVESFLASTHQVREARRRVPSTALSIIDRSIGVSSKKSGTRRSRITDPSL